MAERINPEKKFDIVSDILETLRFRGTIFFHSQLAAPWGVSFEPMDIPRFHIALSGECFVGIDHLQSIQVKHREIVMLPTGKSHWIADSPGRDLVESVKVGEACELNSPMFQSGEITNRLMCGLVQFDHSDSHPMLDALPEIMHFPESKINESTWATATLIDMELIRTNSNSNTIIDRLSEVLFLQLLEEYVQSGEGETGFFAALRDKRIYQALKLIHSELDFHWTLDNLGERVGMSRATLNRHFHTTVGTTPMVYIQNWRMMKSYSLIRHSNSSLDTIAESVGFSSARTLTRAFQRHYGFSPKEARNSDSNL